MSDRPVDLVDALRGRRVLVTGHTGFKGGWLSTWLLELGAEPVGYALCPESPSLFETIGLGERMEHHVGDVRDLARLRSVVKSARADLVVHMAAQALVRRSYAAPAYTFETNVTGTVNVLEAVRASGRPTAVIVVTSDKCYEPLDPPRPHVEDDPLGGRDPYSASKGAAEIVTASYRRSFFPPQQFAEHGVALASARAGNVIGGGDWAEDRIVPDIVRALAAGRPVGLRNPQAVRPWQHVLDALGGYLTLGARLLGDNAARWAGAWNFGPEPGPRLTVQAITERALAAWQAGSWEDLSEPDAPPETAVLELSIRKAVEQLGWHPVYDAETAIDATVAWYRTAKDGGTDLYTATIAQIRDYVERARSPGAAGTAGAAR